MAGVKTISVFLVQRPPARGGWKGDGGLRGGSRGELDSAQAFELPDLGLPPIQGGDCHDGAEREGVWNLAVWAQYSHPTSAPPVSEISPAGAGLPPHPVLPASHGLEAISSSPISALPVSASPSKAFLGLPSALRTGLNL